MDIFSLLCFSDGLSIRSQRLSTVRELFIEVYGNAIPPSPEAGDGDSTQRVSSRSGEVLSGLWGHVKSYFPTRS